MKKENFYRAKEIENEIAKLSRYNLPLTSEREYKLALSVQGKVPHTDGKGEYYPDNSYSHKYNDCPDFLKETVEDALNHAADQIQKKIEKRIFALEREFENLG
jgi:hypothetical protein